MTTATIPTGFFDKVNRAYSGRDGCACGCLGTYYETTNKTFPRMVKKIRGMLDDPTNTDVTVIDKPHQTVVALVKGDRLYMLIRRE